MRKRWPSLIVLMMALSAQSVCGYVRITSSEGLMPRWSQAAIPYVVSEAGSPQVSNGSEFLAVRAAFDTWAAVEEASVQFDYQGTTGVRSAGRDGVNLITFVDETGLGEMLGSTTLAATFSFFTTIDGELVFEESDIAFNTSQRLTTSGEPGRFDIQGILTHEIGHLLGLDHSGLVSSVMAPFGSPDQTDQRALLYDDIAGVAEIYPNPSQAALTGRIAGNVTLNGEALFGGHVVAMDMSGTVVTSTLSGKDGGYTIRFLRPGQYRVYVDPLDAPVSTANIPGFFGSLRTDFGITYFGDTRALSQSGTVAVTAAATTSEVDIQPIAKANADFNLTRPQFAVRASRGMSEAVEVGGVDLAQGTQFSTSSPVIRLDSVSFGGSVGTGAPSSAVLDLAVDRQTPLGPKNILAATGGDLALVNGGVVVTNPRPAEIEVFPSEGSFEGGTIVAIRGRNFQPGIRVYFKGIPASGLLYLNSELLQATVPPNSPGRVNVQLFNPDGTAGLLEGGFDYTPPAPTVSSVQPTSGPPTTSIVIEGSNFDAGEANVTVRFNGVRAPILDVTQTRIETLVPFGAISGPLTVSVFGVEIYAGNFEILAVLPSGNPAPPAARYVSASPSAGGMVADFPNQLREGCVNSRDDGVYVLDLPFMFTHFTDTFLAGAPLSISTNGWMSLEGGFSAEYQNASLPADAVMRADGQIGLVPGALIAPFFDDLILCDDALVTTRVVGAAPNRQLVLQWSGVSILDAVGENLRANMTFEVILYEGSNDVRFVYVQMEGPRSDGASATIGMQNLDRDRAIETGFNQSILNSTTVVTYRFDGGAYTEELSLLTGPPQPVVSDGGARTALLSELTASWTIDDLESSVVAFEYAIGSVPGGTDVRDFTPIQANSVVATGLALDDGATYYFTVRGIDEAGLLSTPGFSDGILVDPDFVATRSVIPYVPDLPGSFAGIAILARVDTDVTLRAVAVDGTEPAGLGIRNPITINLEAGQQKVAFLRDLFGLAQFVGWLELDASQDSLGTYVAIGSNDLTRFDGWRAAPVSGDFYLLYGGVDSQAILANPAADAVTVTFRDLETDAEQLVGIPGRSRIAVPLAGPARITASSPVAAISQFGSGDRLGIGEGISESRSSIVFPFGAAGTGSQSWITLVNTGPSAVETSVTFANMNTSLMLEGGRSTRVRLADLFGLSGDSFESGSVKIEVGDSSDCDSCLVGTMEIETEDGLVALSPADPSADILLPFVATENGLFSGVAMAAGPAGATVKVTIFDTSGKPADSETLTLSSDESAAHLISDLIPSAAGQTGGYVRLESDEPIWAWEIIGTAESIASAPPL